jgi:hypothetical protein
MSRLRKKNKTVKREERNITKKVGKKHHHQYYTRMNYDGRILSVESQQDNQPIRRKKYTLKQLRREIPVAAELINKYLDGKVPRSLHNHNHPPHAVSIYPVLPNPVDLGLLPPAASTTTMPAMMPAESRRAHIGDEFRPISMSSHCSPSTCERGRKHHVTAYDDNNDNDNDDAADDDVMKLFVSERDDDRGHGRRIRFI